LIDLHKQGKRALLLVDEAQNLPLETIEELRMLSNFQADGKPLLQSFLLGQEELQPILRAPNMEQFRQRIVASCHLAPLTDVECQSYIEYRMQQAGWDGKALVSADAYARIFQFTRGVPRKINTLMDRILLFGFLEELETLDEEAVESVIKEVSEEMFLPDNTQSSVLSGPSGMLDTLTEDGQIKDIAYYKNMLSELVDALDNGISQKIKLTRYIDRQLQKKYKSYESLKSDD
jgi:hypothetical protein